MWNSLPQDTRGEGKRGRVWGCIGPDCPGTQLEFGGEGVAKSHKRRHKAGGRVFSLSQAAIQVIPFKS